MKTQNFVRYVLHGVFLKQNSNKVFPFQHLFVSGKTSNNTSITMTLLLNYFKGLGNNFLEIDNMWFLPEITQKITVQLCTHYIASADSRKAPVELSWAIVPRVSRWVCDRMTWRTIIWLSRLNRSQSNDWLEYTWSTCQSTSDVNTRRYRFSLTSDSIVFQSFCSINNIQIARKWKHFRQSVTVDCMTNLNSNLSTPLTVDYVIMATLSGNGELSK